MFSKELLFLIFFLYLSMGKYKEQITPDALAAWQPSKRNSGKFSRHFHFDISFKLGRLATYVILTRETDKIAWPSLLVVIFQLVILVGESLLLLRETFDNSSLF